MPGHVTDHSFGPPAVRHRIQGEQHADWEVGGVEILMHKHVRLRQWRMVEAADAFWRLYWPTQGAAQLFFEGCTHALAPGNLFLIPPHTAFSSVSGPLLAKWFFHFTIAGIGDDNRRGMYRIDPSDRMRALLASTCPAIDNKAGTCVASPTRVLDTIELVTLAVGACLQDLQAPSDFGADGARVMRLLHEKARSGASLAELSQAAGLTDRTLTRLVKRMTGFTPMHYLIELRLNTAMHLLRQTNLPIDRVARQCGFANRYYFTRMFTKRRHLTPAAYRRQPLGS
jgi:AraC-like DNA-binding protein